MDQVQQLQADNADLVERVAELHEALAKAIAIIETDPRPSALDKAAALKRVLYHWIVRN